MRNLLLVTVFLFVAFVSFIVFPAVCYADNLVNGLVDKIPIDLIGWVLAVFALLQAISLFLDFVSKKTANLVDDKIALWLSKALGFIAKGIDFITANRK